MNAAWERVRATAGYLSEREARFLMAAIALAPAHGANLEIGSFKGRSTVGLALIARHYKLGKVIAVDPHTSPTETDPDLQGQSTSYNDFVHNLQAAGVVEHVDIQRTYSYDLATRWSGPIRFLWIDGDHTYNGAKADVDLFKPFLADGAIVAMHDVLGTFDGSLRVFVEELLDSDDFGPAGFHGSIGWAQYRPRDGKRFRRTRQLLAIPARRLIPVALRSVARGRQLYGWNKFLYKVWRPLAPHGDVKVSTFARRIAP
jgi:predicted O-methyltransferase YrrM